MEQGTRFGPAGPSSSLAPAGGSELAHPATISDVSANEASRRVVYVMVPVVLGSAAPRSARPRVPAVCSHLGSRALSRRATISTRDAHTHAPTFLARTASQLGIRDRRKLNCVQRVAPLPLANNPASLWSRSTRPPSWPDGARVHTMWNRQRVAFRPGVRPVVAHPPHPPTEARGRRGTGPRKTWATYLSNTTASQPQPTNQRQGPT
jgi:hypothetical protein